MTGPARLPTGGHIDRSRRIGFTFEGRRLEGFAGDTLASALLANEVRLVGRSFKYHRPRGIVAAGPEEPNALVQLAGRVDEGNIPATMIELYDGLVARAVNRWPSLRFDIGAINGLLARFLPVGFYYKTFMWPSWRLFEPFIRRAAGLGRAPAGADGSSYDVVNAHCDVLVVGGGPAGLTAARAAAATGARVMLAEQGPRFGGRLLWDAAVLDGQSGQDWVDRTLDELRQHPETRLLPRTTAVGYFDDNLVALVETVSQTGEGVRERLWRVRARQVVLATGAVERPLVFPGNDRPGVMLAGAVRRYIGCYAVRPGRRAVVFTNNDEAYATAEALLAAGGAIAAIVDTRPDPGALAERMRAAGIEVLPGARITKVGGRPHVGWAIVSDATGRRRLACDLVAMSGGFSPTVHLFCQSGGSLAFDAELALLKPARSIQSERSVGAAAGCLDLAASIGAAHAAGQAAATSAGATLASELLPPAVEAQLPAPTVTAAWGTGASGKAFVDFQNDVTAADIELAARENFVSVEHLKRYTTLGMGTDQGKTSNVNALAQMAELTGGSVGAVGTTRYRFPYTPVSLGVLGGGQRGTLFRPVRHLPMHAWHVEQEAQFEEYGGWLRPAFYARPGETGAEAERREARAVREAAGLFDGSPLGKIEVKGPDAALFLDRLYANRMSSLKVGRTRYGLMLNDHGAIIDDGVVCRLGADHFLVSTTSGGAAQVAAAMEEWLQCDWPDLRVVTAQVTTAFAVATITGPAARRILHRLAPDLVRDAADFPHMAVRAGEVAGLAARVARISFTGEQSYEINVAADRGEELCRRIMAAGESDGITPVGIDAWMVLRTEKGYLHIGTDTDGQTGPDDVGFGHVLKREDDFVGKRSLLRPVYQRPDRLQFVGLRGVGSLSPPAVGAHLLTAGGAPEGYVTSSVWSPTLGRGVALGMVVGGRNRLGERFSLSDGTGVVEIVAPCAYDPEGQRLHG